MKRSKLGATEQGRRARLQTSAAEDSEAADPIALAAQAKKSREDARIKAAAEAAAKAFAGKAKTVFYDRTGPSTGIESSVGPTPDKASSAGVQPELAPNPLAAILGYEQDDSASEDGSEPPSPRHPAGLTPHTTNVIPSGANTNGDEDDPMLASFMSELESSGLLDKDSPQPPGPMEEHTASAAPETHTSGGSSSPSSGAEQPGPQSAEAEANLAATIVKAVTDDQGEVVRQEEAGKVLEQHPSEASGLVSEPAEQRVLGDLQGAPTWREVMDMATGKVYFWDSATDEVAWEPPAGAQPRSKHDNAATFAAHVSAADSPTAGVSGTAAVASDLAAPVVTGVLEVQFPEAAGTENAADAKQAGSTSEGSPAHTGAPSTTEDQEEGQLAEVRSASRSPPVEAPLVHLLPPDIQLGTLGQQVVDQIRSSTHTLCRNIPQLVRLAVEAEIRLEDWHMFSTKQQQAVDSSQAETAVSWTDVQDHLRWRWQSINAALPAAVQEAQQLHARMDQELEAGEMPPLPCEDAVAAAADAVQLPPNQTAMSVDAADPVATLDSAHLGASAAVSDPALSDASGFGEGVGLADPSEAPPLPAEDPESIPMAVSVANAVSSTNGGAGAADDDTDMELDMEVDDNSGASRPASAESTGQDAAAASGAALPDWAGYYMAHGYRYPYYGQAAPAIASTSQPDADAAAQPSAGAPAASHHAADLPASRLATSSTPPAEGASPAPQLPVPVKRKQYKAEPAPAFPSPVDQLDAVETATISAHSASGTEKQVPEAEAKKRKRPKAPVGLGQLAAKKKKSSKGISGMIDKWQAVRKEEEDEQAKAEEELDPAVQERRRLAQAEQWRLQQLKTGAASEGNANFQPLSVDWREKLKTNRKASVKGSSNAPSPEPASVSPAAGSVEAGVTADVSMTADGKPNLELLSKGLPAGWRAMWDKNTGDIYYGNLKSRRAGLLEAYQRGRHGEGCVTTLSAGDLMGQTQVASLITDTQRGQSPARAKNALKQAAFIDF